MPKKVAAKSAENAKKISKAKTGENAKKIAAKSVETTKKKCPKRKLERMPKKIYAAKTVENAKDKRQIDVKSVFASTHARCFVSCPEYVRYIKCIMYMKYMRQYLIPHEGI